MEEDGVVTFKEFQAVCLDLAPKATSKKGEATITRNSISSAFSSVVADDSGDQEIPVPAFKSFIVNFIARLKNSILKKVYEFVSENSKVLLSQCESRETQEMTKKGYSSGYLSFNNFKRVFEKEKYDLTDQEMNALRNSHPKFFKEEKVFYKSLIEDICKSAKSIQQQTKTAKSKDKNFFEILEAIKRRVNYDQGQLLDEFSCYDNQNDEQILLMDCFEIIEELLEEKLSKQFIQQFCDKLLSLKDDLVNYRKIVSLIFTGKTSIKDQFDAINHEIVAEFSQDLQQELVLRGVPSHEFFKYFDTDNDGKISLDEFVTETKEICLQYSEKHLKQIYEKILMNFAKDKNSFDLKTFQILLYGYLLQDYRPLLNHLKAEISYRNVNAEKFFQDQVRFKQKNKKANKLNFQEFLDLLKKLDKQIGVIEADILFSNFVRDNSGQISFEEFVEHFQEESYLNQYGTHLKKYMITHNYSIRELVGMYSE